MPQELDCRHLQCPMPIVQISLAVNKLSAGDELVVEATDPAFEADLRAWCEMTGHKLLAFEAGPTQRASLQVIGNE